MDINLLQTMIEVKLGYTLDEEKVFHLVTKLMKVLPKTNTKTIEELYKEIMILHNEELLNLLIDAITVHETFWFRDKTPWLILEEVLLPKYIEELRTGKRSHVKIWSGACSYGQEPYSIAMSIDRYIKGHDIHDVHLGQFEIFASDLSDTALNTARKGIYDSISIERGLEDPIREMYFKKVGKNWHLHDDIKHAVTFMQQNLIKDFYLNNQYDCIFLRNVLIYFSEEQKREILTKIKEALKPGGTLFVGSSELLSDYQKDFVKEEYKNGIYFRKIIADCHLLR